MLDDDQSLILNAESIFAERDVMADDLDIILDEFDQSITTASDFMRDVVDDDDLAFDTPQAFKADAQSSHTVADLDPLTVRLQNALASGKLAKDHLLYIALDDALRYAACAGKKQFEWNKTLVRFCETLRYHGHPKTLHLLRGRAQHGKGKRGGRIDFDFDDYNFVLPGENAVGRERPGYTTSNGIVRDLLSAFLKLANGHATPIVDHNSVRLFAAGLSRDGMTLKPGLQFDLRQKLVVGADTQIDLDFVNRTPSLEASWIKQHLFKEANECLLSLLSGELSLPVGTAFAAISKTGAGVCAEATQMLETMSQCLACVAKADCPDSTLPQNVCVTSPCAGRHRLFSSPLSLFSLRLQDQRRLRCLSCERTHRERRRATSL